MLLSRHKLWAATGCGSHSPIPDPITLVVSVTKYVSSAPLGVSHLICIFLYLNDCQCSLFVIIYFLGHLSQHDSKVIHLRMRSLTLADGKVSPIWWDIWVYPQDSQEAFISHMEFIVQIRVSLNQVNSTFSVNTTYSVKSNSVVQKWL